VAGNYFTEMCSGSEAGSYLRLVDSCITQLKAQGPSMTCNESKEEEEDNAAEAFSSECAFIHSDLSLWLFILHDLSCGIWGQVPCRHSGSDFTLSRPLVIFPD